MPNWSWVKQLKIALGNVVSPSSYDPHPLLAKDKGLIEYSIFTAMRRQVCNELPALNGTWRVRLAFE